MATQTLNPFAEGENRNLTPDATCMVIFGASGDLTSRKLLPALYNLYKDGFLPKTFSIIGVSRTPLSDDAFREKIKTGIEKFSRSGIDPKKWSEFSSHVFYQPLDATKDEDFISLREKIKKVTPSIEEPNLLHYLAVSPNFFGIITKALKKAQLIDPSGHRGTRVIVEKPIGFDLESSRKLNAELYESAREDQLYRIDHYLGKETVQNILVFRFANGLFEPLWNSRYIDHIQITVAEEIGVENRGSYFDEAGIIRDFIQNHVLQMLSLLCIEPPQSFGDAESIRNEKVKVLKSIKRLTPADVSKNVIRGQYSPGLIKGEPAKGYLEENGIKQNSETDTFVAMKLELDNWRWQGVPIFIRVGKRLPKRISEISIHFKNAPIAPFKDRQIDFLEPNILSIQVQPKEGISLRVNTKPPGPRMRVNAVEMDFTYQGSYGVPSPEAYERLLLDAMRGEATLFTRVDEIEEAWGILEPIFAAWRDKSNAPELFKYEAGTWGPQSASSILPPGTSWRKL